MLCPYFYFGKKIAKLAFFQIFFKKNTLCCDMAQRTRIFAEKIE